MYALHRLKPHVHTVTPRDTDTLAVTQAARQPEPGARQRAEAMPWLYLHATATAQLLVLS